jgi:hypothetical protein
MELSEPHACHRQSAPECHARQSAIQSLQSEMV